MMDPVPAGTALKHGERAMNKKCCFCKYCLYKNEINICDIEYTKILNDGAKHVERRYGLAVKTCQVEGDCEKYEQTGSRI